MQEGKLSSSSLVLSKAGTVGRVVSRAGASRQVRRGKAALGRAGQVRRGALCCGMVSHGSLGEAELAVVWQGR
jgi:hypothetical protein